MALDERPQLLDLQFAPTGATAVMPAFEINDPLWRTTTKILGPGSGGVFSKAPGNISGNTGIERIVRTENHIDLPIHNHHVHYLLITSGTLRVHGSTPQRLLTSLQMIRILLLYACDHNYTSPSSQYPQTRTRFIP